jgi:hypothetical protein
MASPTKQAVHDWMMQRQQVKTPPPSPEEIRRQLGWHLTPGFDRLGKAIPR